MFNIKILGTGCPKCAQLTENTQIAAQQADVEVQIDKVTDINEIMKFGVMVTPALVIDGEVKSAGKVLSADDIQAMLQPG